MSLGSGTLIAKKPNYGFVITNWHVIRDSSGFVTVKFPDSKTYDAAVVAVDDRWDLALLVIAEPKGVDPVVISPFIPKIGETLWVAGYRGGDGTYRIHDGRFIRFQAPEKHSVEAGLIEISVPSESGDSGGPIFNAKYQLAGVLFGSTATTVGSHCGRVFKLLEDAAPHVMSLPATPEPVIKAASLSRQSILQRGEIAFGSSTTQETRPVTVQNSNTYSSSVSSSMSFGGSGIRTRDGIQEAPSRTYTRRELHGFLNIEYDLSVANTLLAAERRTGTNLQSSTPASGNFSLAGNSTQNSPGTSSDNTARSIQPINRTGTQGSLQGGMVTTTPITTTQTSTMPGWGNPSSTYPQSIGINAAPAAAETLPTSFSNTTLSQTTLPQTAGASSVYGVNANSGIGNGNTNSGGSYNTETAPKPATGTFDTPVRRSTETTQGGTRSGTGSTSNGTTHGMEPGGRTVPTSAGYNTYTQNSVTTQPTSSNPSLGNSFGSSHDFASQYALDSSDMQMDEDYAPKYADDFVADSHGADVTGAASKYDAIKIVIAILVIFFILFHTIKTMAVAEERQSLA